MREDENSHVVFEQTEWRSSFDGSENDNDNNKNDSNAVVDESTLSSPCTPNDANSLASMLLSVLGGTTNESFVSSSSDSLSTHSSPGAVLGEDTSPSTGFESSPRQTFQDKLKPLSETTPTTATTTTSLAFARTTRTSQGQEQKQTQSPQQQKCNDSASFHIFPSSKDFMHYWETTCTLSPKQVNRNQLSLNLAWNDTLDPESNPALIKLRKLIRWIHTILFIHYWEGYIMQWYHTSIPLSWKQIVNWYLWNYCYVPIHKMILGRKTGIHPSVSYEYHALTTLCWLGRFFPVTIQRARFGLAQLSTVCYTSPSSTSSSSTSMHVESICEQSIEPQEDNATSLTESKIPSCQKNHTTVRGVFIHSATKSRCDDNGIPPTTLFWIFGGAFVGGDVPANIPAAKLVGQRCNMNVFLPTHRLTPDHGTTMNDIIWDVSLAYRWLVQRLQKQYPNHPPTIILWGISSGGGLALKLLQALAELGRGEECIPTYLSSILYMQDESTQANSTSDTTRTLPMPRAAVVFGPFVDYTDPKGTFLEYSRHDLIVTPRVMETIVPFGETHMNGQRIEHSPIHRSFQGLPPLCFVVSQHEAVYDMVVAAIQRAHADGVSVTVGVWKYMCHVWSLLYDYLPEGKESMDFVCDWLVSNDTSTPKRSL